MVDFEQKSFTYNFQKFLAYIKIAPLATIGCFGLHTRSYDENLDEHLITHS